MSYRNINEDLKRRLFWTATHTNILMYTSRRCIEHFARKMDKTDRNGKRDGAELRECLVIREKEHDRKFGRSEERRARIDSIGPYVRCDGITSTMDGMARDTDVDGHRSSTACFSSGSVEIFIASTISRLLALVRM